MTGNLVAEARQLAHRPVSGPPAGDAPDGREATPARTSWDETARGWSRMMFGGAQSSVGQAGTAVATVIGGALGTLLVRHSIFVLAGAVAYGLMALGLYCSGPVCRSLSRQLRRPGQVAPDAASTETVAAPQEPVTKAPVPPRRYYEQILAANQSGNSTVASHFAVAALPFPSVLGGQDLAISAGSPHPAQALKVIDFLTSAEAEHCRFAVGGFPATRRSAYSGEGALPAGYAQVTGHPLCGTQAGPEAKIGPTVLAAIGTAIPRPVTRYYTEFSTAVQDQVWPMLARASQNSNPGVPGVVSALATALEAAATGHLPDADG